MFMTSKQLEESVKNGNPYGITEDASKVEAFVNENAKEIVIIMDANKSLSSLVGHEVTHTLESATLYEGVKSIAINLAKMRGEYDGRWESIQRRYKNYTEEEQMQELVSDLIGDYLFGDTEFIKNLSTENPNAFQKIYNEIKHILKLATAGSKEARELERLKKEFEKVWREGSKGNTNATKYSIVESFVDNNGTKFDNAVLLDTDYFEGTSPRNWGKMLKKYLEQRTTESTFIMPITDENGDVQKLEFAKRNDYVSKDNGKQHPVLGKLYSTTDNISKLSTIHVDEIVEISGEDNPYYSGNNNHGWLELQT